MILIYSAPSRRQLGAGTVAVHEILRELETSVVLVMFLVSRVLQVLHVSPEIHTLIK